MMISKEKSRYMVEFVEYDIEFLYKSTDWLSDKEIKYLTFTPDIDPVKQREWFDSLKDRQDYLVWGVCYDKTPIGVLGLKHINVKESNAEYFGYIGEKGYWGKGIGTNMMHYCEDMARKLGVTEIYLRVLQDNTRAIRLYEKMGYKSAKTEDGLIVMTKVIC